MRFQTRRIDWYLDTMWAVAHSKQVEGYVIGFTAQQLWARYSGYRQLGYQHMVILEDKLNRADALFLEGKLQASIKNDKRNLVYRKYHHEKRDKRHYPSAGQATMDPDELYHSVYMAWWDVE